MTTFNKFASVLVWFQPSCHCLCHPLLRFGISVPLLTSVCAPYFYDMSQLQLRGLVWTIRDYFSNSTSPIDMERRQLFASRNTERLNLPVATSNGLVMALSRSKALVNSVSSRRSDIPVPQMEHKMADSSKTKKQGHWVEKKVLHSWIWVRYKTGNPESESGMHPQDRLGSTSLVELVMCCYLSFGCML